MQNLQTNLHIPATKLVHFLEICKKSCNFVYIFFKKMKEKQNFLKTTTGFVVLNICLAIVLAIVLLVMCTGWLKRYTLHGKEVSIPSVVGMTEQEAQMVLQGSNLYLVVIDSTYSNKAELGTIVEQTPPPSSHAKPDRPVYVVMNARTKRLIPLPELRDVSFRQAEATLRAIGLKVGDVQYEPSIYPDNVLDIRDGEKSLEEGTRLEEGSAVTLVIGRRQGNKMVNVPPLLGMSLSQARSTLLAAGLTIGAYEYDEEPTPETLESFIIFRQTPVEGTPLLEGSTVNINLTTNLERAITTGETQNEEKFF